TASEGRRRSEQARGQQHLEHGFTSCPCELILRCTRENVYSAELPHAVHVREMV
ncbi:MAG: hypothetical protein ACI9K2_004404, partial [Myxococcota bacterium]